MKNILFILVLAMLTNACSTTPEENSGVSELKANLEFLVVLQHSYFEVHKKFAHLDRGLEIPCGQQLDVKVEKLGFFNVKKCPKNTKFSYTSTGDRQKFTAFAKVYSDKDDACARVYSIDSKKNFKEIKSQSTLCQYLYN